MGEWRDVDEGCEGFQERFSGLKVDLGGGNEEREDGNRRSEKR